jgi:GMP synthase-like glutamine amidotransferase
VARELEVVGAAVEGGVPVLGLCFGGEVLSAVMGGSVGRSPEPELGWREIRTDEPSAIPAGPWLEWHYDSFTTPPGAVEVARTETAVQAFRKGPHLGVQFHPESTVEIVSAWAEMDAERLSGMGVDDWRPLLEVSTDQQEAARRSAFRFFDAFVSGIQKHRGKVSDS